MAGVKGSGGPPPKRSDQRRRRNAPPQEITKAEGAPEVERPEPDERWHPAARRWFESLGQSGQSQFYEPSDWAVAYVLAESISREFNPQQVVMMTKDGIDVTEVTLPPKSGSISAWLKGMTALLATEGDRRRASMELQRPGPEPEGDVNVSEIEQYRRRIQSQ